jgi:translation initiation factor IF-2
LAKNLKLTIKNTQIAEAVNLGSLKDKLASKNAAALNVPANTEAAKPEPIKAKPAAAKTTKVDVAKTDELSKEIKEETPKIRARSRSAFAEPVPGETKPKQTEEIILQEPKKEEPAKVSISAEEETPFAPLGRRKTSEELRKEIFAEELKAQSESPPAAFNPLRTDIPKEIVSEKDIVEPEPLPKPMVPAPRPPARAPTMLSLPKRAAPNSPYPFARENAAPIPKLGPTGKHVKDLIPPKQQPKPKQELRPTVVAREETQEDAENKKAKFKGKQREDSAPSNLSEDKKSGSKSAKFKEFKDIKPAKKTEQIRFDARDRQGLRESDEEQHWRKKRSKQAVRQIEDVTIRPTSLKVRIPIAIKDLASEMKLKASQLITKLFSQGVVVTLNDILEDETTIQLLGHEFGCEISIDSSEEERIRITDKTIKEEIQATDLSLLKTRPPVVAFMGHVDHGKTSLIDAIRKSNRAAGEAGAITQHIGAFRCSTPVGDIAILDTPGHEAFSAMRARGADATDIVVLVVAGDEGMRQQTLEALQHAKAANVTIVVAINKSDKPNFNAETVYRQLSENELLPEVWGGQTITINCSAVTGEGIQQLLEMLALQAEILELKADPTGRARGTVLESEMHKGMGSIATVLVQNGTLNVGDALVFGQHWGRVKTMRDEFGKELEHAGPSTPVEITGMSGLPEAGQEFIVVKTEREAREIAEARMLGIRQVNLLQAKKLSMENLFQQAAETNKKILNIILRADVQGSLEALKAALVKIESKKAEINIIYTGVGEVSESDVQLAAASKAVIIGFHTQIESHADAIVKQLGIQVRLHDIIYHAVDDVKLLLSGLLDKIAQETERGKLDVLATFKSSQYGIIAGCMVTDGVINRNYSVRIKRGKEILWKGTISSLKRVKEDVREVSKGLECGVVLNGFNGVKEGDTIEAYEITYITQEL